MYKNRNLFVQFVLFVITLGIYGIYWFYSALDEMIKARDGNMSGNENACLWAALSIFPIIGYWAYWKHAAAVDGATNTELNKVAMFVLAIVFYPAYWLIIQSALNSRSGQQPSASAAITQ